MSEISNFCFHLKKLEEQDKQKQAEERKYWRVEISEAENNKQKNKLKSRWNYKFFEKNNKIHQTLDRPIRKKRENTSY